MVREFGMVDDYDLEPVHSVYDYLLQALVYVPNVNDVVEQELTFVKKDFYQMEVPSSSKFFTDGSKGDRDHYGDPESSFYLRQPRGVFSAVLVGTLS
jgi:hypothetical protein